MQKEWGVQWPPLSLGWHQGDNHCWPPSQGHCFVFCFHKTVTGHTHWFLFVMLNIYSQEKNGGSFENASCVWIKRAKYLTRTKPLTLAHSLITQKMTGSWEHFLDIFYTSVTFWLVIKVENVLASLVTHSSYMLSSVFIRTCPFFLSKAHS